MFLRRFLDELGLGPASPTALATDNKAARDLAYNPEHHEKSKHVERRHFYVRELVENEELIVPFVSTTANMADFFTKPLAGEAFFRLRNSIMNLPPRSGSAAHACPPARATSPEAPTAPAAPPTSARFVCCSCGGADL